MMHGHFGSVVNKDPQWSKEPAFEGSLEKNVSTTLVNPSYGTYLLLSYTTLQPHSFPLLCI